MIIFYILGCTRPNTQETAEEIVDSAQEPAIEEEAPFCGDGIINQGEEECDDGQDNSDTLGNACRENCTLPYCGDGVTDDLNEECDDGNFWNLDGCSEGCILEVGTFEQEPNSSVSQAEVPQNMSIQGSLWEGDVDCFSFSPTDNDYMNLWISPDESIEENEELISICHEPVQLSIYKDGLWTYTEYPEDDQTCTSLQYMDQPEFRFLDEAENLVVCIEGFLGSAVSSYTLNWELFPDSCSLEDISFTQEEDPDFDLLANNCDDDDDNDGIIDEEDNCPVQPNNGPVMYYTGADGFLLDWLVLGPIPGQSTSGCQAVAGMTTTPEADLVPSIGEFESFHDGSSHQWSLYRNTDTRINFLGHSELGSQSAPREVFAATWIYSEIDQPTAQLKIGPDDGAKAWFNGVLIGETTACQGTVVDRYTYDAPLQEGWNRLVIQVRDSGGGWGLYARFVADGTPITNIVLSPLAYGFLEDIQLDSDEDGIGDQCDQ